MGALARIFACVGALGVFACSSSGKTDVIVDPIVFAGDCQLDPDRPADAFADCVEKFAPAAPATFGQDRMPEIVLGAPQGAGAGSGSLDVASLGCGGSITLFFDDPPIADGPGADFTVFENPFIAGATTFTEPAAVAVSADGKDWYDFPCDFLATQATGCAGLSPVLSSPANGVSPLDPAVSGGDAFDLQASGLATVRYVRLTDKTKLYYETQGQGTGFYCGLTGGFDLDAVASLH